MESPSDITALTEFDKILSNLLQFLEKNKTVPKTKLQSRISILPSTQKTLLISFFSSRNSEENTKSAATIQPKNGNNVESPPQIVITDTLKNTFKEWKNKTETYFEEGSEVSKEYHWGLAIGRLEQRESEVEVNRIKSRLEKLNMFRSAVDHNYHTGNKWYKDGSSLLVEVIQRQYPSVDEKNKTDAKRLEAAIQEGRNYDMWAEFLGDDGYLAALPLDVHESKYYDRRHRLEIKEKCIELLELGIKRIVDDYDLVNLGTIVSKRLQEQLQVDDYFDVKEGRKRAKTSPGKPKNKSHEYKRRRVDIARTSSANHRSSTATAGANTERLGGNISVHESQHTRANSSANGIQVNQRTELDHLSRSTQNWHFLEGSPLRAAIASQNQRLSNVHTSPKSRPQNAALFLGQTSANNTNDSSIPTPAVQPEDTECSNFNRQSDGPLEPFHYESRSNFNAENPGNSVAFRTCSRKHQWSRERDMDLDTSRVSAPQPRVPDSEDQCEARKTWSTGVLRAAPDTISLQLSPLMNTEGWTSAEYQRNDIPSSTPYNKNTAFHLGSDVHQCQTAESTAFPSMNRDPDHNASLHPPESQSSTNTDSYADQSVHISQESTENLNSTAQVMETLLPYLFVPPSPVDTMSPSNHPQFVPPTSIDTTIFSSYPQFAPLDMMMFSDYPQFIPEPPQELDMGNLFNNGKVLKNCQ
ncbi:hypothetical protein BDV40DRAFT_283430 [Aspergillus tamarii]|uniref:Uncharacterized protein n=1 Tax=Aspergillus tamarii TaxID=41984 RepID=A0A5N6UAF1_ASPTM|nr:hypothetical protein BDV40DRAFT_283430 [Aspergillus tamarii]